MKPDMPLSQLGQAMLLATIDVGPGVTARAPAGDEPTAADWLEELLQAVERRAGKMIGRTHRKKPPSAKIAAASEKAESALNLCRAVRVACSAGSPVFAATAAIMAVSELWRAEDANALTD